ncbi:hypothetical protein TWF696_005724 [Orbilia brochopaga]|uniref:Uncharacterized protein n=1 Tax=Orbilia brochopaga TaxID=3140254 RepID=A0AAV9UU03_9PEZI
MADPKLLELPYELQFQILAELLEPVVSFVFYSPVQTLEWREDMEQYGFKDLGIEESKTLPCTVSISMPSTESIVPPACLLVSRDFATLIRTVAKEHCDHLHKRLSKCFVGATPYRYISQEPGAITPEFLRYVSTGRIVFAGYSVNTIKTIKEGIPQAVREAVTSVFCSRINMMQMWSGTPIGNMKVWRRPGRPDYSESIAGTFQTSFPQLKKIGFAMAKRGTKEEFWCPEAMSAMCHLLRCGVAKELEIAYGEDDMDEFGVKREQTRGVGYACCDWRLFMGAAGWFADIDGEPYWLFGRSSFSLKATRVSGWDVQRRGKYMDLSDMPTVEEDVVWKITGAKEKIESMLVTGLFILGSQDDCPCRKCKKDRGQPNLLDQPRADGKVSHRWRRLMRVGRKSSKS